MRLISTCAPCWPCREPALTLPGAQSSRLLLTGERSLYGSGYGACSDSHGRVIQPCTSNTPPSWCADSGVRNRVSDLVNLRRTALGVLTLRIAPTKPLIDCRKSLQHVPSLPPHYPLQPGWGRDGDGGRATETAGGNSQRCHVGSTLIYNACCRSGCSCQHRSTTVEQIC